MSAKRRFFWCDAPSPLHEAKAAAIAAQDAAVAKLVELAKSLGATTFAGRRDGFVSGLVFDGDPPRDRYHWTEVGKTDDGCVIYAPQRRTTEGKALARRLSTRQYEPADVAVAVASGMYVSMVQGRYLAHTTSGWKDERIFLSVPSGGEGGDEFPKVPDYLTECPEWEMQRWFDLGRGGAT